MRKKKRKEGRKRIKERRKEGKEPSTLNFGAR
jgi:hypothetical protein